MTVVLPHATVPFVTQGGRVHEHWYSIIKLWVDEHNARANKIAKAWGLVTVASGSPSLTASVGVESVLDDGVGTFTVAFSAALASASFAPVVTINAPTGNRSLTSLVTARTTSGFTVAILREGATAGSAAAVVDDISFSFAVFSS